jgi:hypothetical protein
MMVVNRFAWWFTQERQITAINISYQGLQIVCMVNY